MSVEIITDGWYGAKDMRTQHQIIERMGTRFLSTCGLSIPADDLIEKSRFKMCKSCRRNRRDFFKRTKGQNK